MIKSMEIETGDKLIILRNITWYLFQRPDEVPGQVVHEKFDFDFEYCVAILGDNHDTVIDYKPTLEELKLIELKVYEQAVK